MEKSLIAHTNLDRNSSLPKHEVSDKVRISFLGMALGNMADSMDRSRKRSIQSVLVLSLQIELDFQLFSSFPPFITLLLSLT